MRIIIIPIIIVLWVVLHRLYPYEGFITTEEVNELTQWFDLATELKTEIACVR